MHAGQGWQTIEIFIRTPRTEQDSVLSNENLELMATAVAGIFVNRH